MKTLPHASRGWWGGTEGGTEKVLFVTDTEILVETPEIDLELGSIEILLEVEIEEE